MNTPTVPTVPLRGGTAIPQLGLGTWPLKGAECEAAVASALDLGYRHIDTAELYENEDAVGRAIAASGITRDELFVTTKITKTWHGADLARQGLEGCLERLGLDRVDLILIHWPNPDLDRYVETFAALLEARDAGLASAVGVSNFKPAHLQRLQDEVGELPVIDQIECNPYKARHEVREWLGEHDVVVESWRPIAKGKDLFDEPAVAALADKHGCTPAQAVLAWHLAQGIVTMPKSADPGRQRENLEALDVTLSAADVESLAGLDRGEEAAVDSDTTSI